MGQNIFIQSVLFILKKNYVPLESVDSDLLNVGGEGGLDRSFDGDRCSSPEELVPSDWVSESKNFARF